MTLVKGINGEPAADPAAREQLFVDCLTGLWLAVTAATELMSPGGTAEIVTYLAASTEDSALSTQPGSLRVERFLSGYYLQTC